MAQIKAYPVKRCLIEYCPINQLLLITPKSFDEEGLILQQKHQLVNRLLMANDSASSVIALP